MLCSNTLDSRDCGCFVATPSQAKQETARIAAETASLVAAKAEAERAEAAARARSALADQAAAVEAARLKAAAAEAEAAAKERAVSEPPPATRIRSPLW